jgi:hypothetical protein
LRPYLVVKRLSTGILGTFGAILDTDGTPFAVTLEPEWKNNEQDVSCIPAGDYLCLIVDSPKYGRVYEITNVPCRDHILIHKLNRVRETKGCIGVGEEFGLLDGKPAILDSGKAFNELMDVKLKDTLEFWISIRWGL